MRARRAIPPGPGDCLRGMATSPGVPCDRALLWRGLAVFLGEGCGTPAFRAAVVAELAGLARRCGEVDLADAWEVEAGAMRAAGDGS